MLPTLRSVLRSPTVQAAEPEVLAGGSHLDRSVRWVHVSEVVDISDLLLGGELILSTGLSLGGPGADPVRYLEDLAGAGACGLMVELSDRFCEVPDAVVDVARDRGFPIIVLHQKVRFVDITEEVHRKIVTEQYASLQFGQQVHEAFTALSLEGASSQKIIETTALLCQATVVLEDLSRRVVAYATPMKHRLAGVDADLLAAVGPVSERTVIALAAGVRAATGADWAVATTGVAGPASQDGHEPGEVWVGIAGPTLAATAVRYDFTGDRAAVRTAAVQAALALVAGALAAD